VKSVIENECLYAVKISIAESAST